MSRTSRFVIGGFLACWDLRKMPADFSLIFRKDLNPLELHLYLYSDREWENTLLLGTTTLALLFHLCIIRLTFPPLELLPIRACSLPCPHPRSNKFVRRDVYANHRLTTTTARSAYDGALFSIFQTITHHHQMS